MWQQFIGIGNVGGEVTLKYSPQGIAICDFSLAINKRTGKGEDKVETTTWIKVTCWRERAETASQFIKKGARIMVVGEIKASAYLDKSGRPAASLELTCSDFKSLDSRSDSDQSPARTNATRNDDPADIPF